MEAGVVLSELGRPTEGASKPVWMQLLLRSLHQRHMQIGLTLTLFMIALALLGPLFAPHSTSTFVAPPFSTPSAQAPLGTDYLGDDVLSRVLGGGLSVVALSFAATAFGVLLGVIVGLIAGYSRSFVDDALMGVSDVVLSFPQIVLVLVFVSILGPKLWLIVVVVGLSHSPRVARLTRSVTLELIKREFVESAELLGIRRRRIFIQEILPNLVTPLLVETGLRLTWSIGVIAALSFLGFGIQAPHADWGLMINENRSGLTQNVWAVMAPILCIALFTIGTNLMTEGLSRTVTGIDSTPEAP
ncbi:MAG TPA: ABC transporter permease [Solirubrobacteraceae bacterium]|jgi:peptide/nickel transport system permease protein|nr:ABC transporter permease [Solirubrobacteraceae bacterium]